MRSPLVINFFTHCSNPFIIYFVQADATEGATKILLGFRVDILVPVDGEIEVDGVMSSSSDLYLFGQLEYDFTEQKVAGELGMRGTWRKAFSIEWLALGNIFVG